MLKSYSDINKKIRDGSVNVITAEEMVELVKKEGLEYAAESVDVVTTGTFGCMCLSGAFFNLKQPDPPIKIDSITLDGVPAYHGNAAADFYLGVTKSKQDPLFSREKNQENQVNSVAIDENYHIHKVRNQNYGGGHVLERLVNKESIKILATSLGTDCYPRKSLELAVTLDDFNQAYLLNPRNAYQNYVCAVNSSDKPIYTYMGKLLPNLQNGTFGGVGTLSPLNNDPTYKTIGLGTKIFLGGGPGVILGEGTQHNPKTQFGNVMVKGDLKQMSPEFITGADIEGYGVSCFIGLGIPIPILDESLAATTSKDDSKLFTEIMDYSTGTRDRPILKKVSYQELKSGKVELNGKQIPVSSTSSLYKSRKIAKILKKWIKYNRFLLNAPITSLSEEMVCESLPKERYQ
jgi:uncharacterized protein (DUF39 family)